MHRIRWTFQMVEDFDDHYWTYVREFRQRLCDQLTDGRLHAHEAQLKEQRRSAGRPHHEAGPQDLGEPAPGRGG